MQRRSEHRLRALGLLLFGLTIPLLACKRGSSATPSEAGIDASASSNDDASTAVQDEPIPPMPPPVSSETAKATATITPKNYKKTLEQLETKYR